MLFLEAMKWSGTSFSSKIWLNCITELAIYAGLTLFSSIDFCLDIGIKYYCLNIIFLHHSITASKRKLQHHSYLYRSPFFQFLMESVSTLWGLGSRLDWSSSLSLCSK
jgi:hypothetical protein